MRSGRAILSKQSPMPIVCRSPRNAAQPGDHHETAAHRFECTRREFRIAQFDLRDRRAPSLGTSRRRGGHRDLAAQTLPHFTPVLAEGHPCVSRNAEILDEFLAADVVVIGAPMYNFTIPSQLKAW